MVECQRLGAHSGRHTAPVGDVRVGVTVIHLAACSQAANCQRLGRDRHACQRGLCQRVVASNSAV